MKDHYLLQALDRLEARKRLAGQAAPSNVVSYSEFLAFMHGRAPKGVCEPDQESSDMEALPAHCRTRYADTQCAPQPSGAPVLQFRSRLAISE